MSEIAEKIARKFREIVSADLSEHLEEIDRINRERNDDTCATHDYCDANMLMLDAFELIHEPFFGEDGHSSEAHMRLWGEAWGIAKRTGFSTPL